MFVRLTTVGVLVASFAANAGAQVPDLRTASLEDLLNMTITSAEKKEQRAEDVPAALYVITQDAIRRSGLTTLPELFRLVPGMQVAQINANKWAISIRGFNDLFSNKLLVLIDGRSIYNRSFSGVFWDVEDLLVQDIERIEVVRGPGGAMWGANAVNGVINIITKSAADTKGTSVNLSAGTFDRDQTSVRYGGAAGGAAYRVYSQWSDYAASLSPAGTAAGDTWNSLTMGGRVDWTQGADAVMAQGNFTTGKSHPLWKELAGPVPGVIATTNGVSDIQSSSLLGRWAHTRPDGSVFQAQAFKTSRHRDETTLVDSEDIVDIDLQYHTTIGGRHDVVLGGGYRDDNFTSQGTFTLDIAPAEGRVANAFLQDEISLGRRFKLTIGSKLEHDNLAGWGVLPSVRAMWNVTPTTQRLWAAISRARRTPASTDLTLRASAAVIPGNQGPPLLIEVLGNPAYQSELLTEVEGGYRWLYRAGDQ